MRHQALTILLLLSYVVWPLQAAPRRYQQPIFNSKGVHIGPGQQLTFKFRVEDFLRRARLVGHIQARGGSGNDVRVLVYRDQTCIYDSGQSRSIVMSLPIADPADYELIISNHFSIFSTKLAFGYAELIHDGVDEGKSQLERQKAARRQRDAEALFGKLYVTLQNWERELGTHQMPRRPSLAYHLSPDINAYADATHNRITINRGMFELMEARSEYTRHILAGIIGHELGHLFYHHTVSTQGGLWDEITGALRLDRREEEEADRFAVQLACRAGFRPDGLALCFKSLSGAQGGVGLSHPETGYRIRVIEQEARRCGHRSPTSPPRTPSDSWTQRRGGWRRRLLYRGLLPARLFAWTLSMAALTAESSPRVLRSRSCKTVNASGPPISPRANTHSRSRRSKWRCDCALVSGAIPSVSK